MTVVQARCDSLQLSPAEADGVLALAESRELRGLEERVRPDHTALKLEAALAMERCRHSHWRLAHLSMLEVSNFCRPCDTCRRCGPARRLADAASLCCTLL